MDFMDGVVVPITPNASKDVSGAEVSGIWSRGTAEIDESPYLILTG